MFRPTNPQISLLESEFLLPPEKVERLKKSWAEPFRTLVMPLIDEEAFRDAFSSSGTGRPNKSIRLLTGLHLLKEWNDLTDEQVLDQFEYNLQWHYALGIEPATAHVCQKTLHNFRVKLMENDRAQRMFNEVTRGLAAADGLDLGRQRLDSTHVISNIAVLTRLGLFVETVTTFLRELKKEAPERLAALAAGFEKRYLEREGYFADAKREQARRRLPVVARDVHTLLVVFRDDPLVSALPTYGLLLRLFDDQCELVDEDDSDDGAGAGAHGGAGASAKTNSQPRVKLREPKTIASTSLQSPHDADATYGHKGKGYEVQLTETCTETNPYQVVTSVSVQGAHESDQKALVPIVDHLDEVGMKPDELSADTGYGSGANIVACAERDVDLKAPVQDPDAPPPTDPFAASVDIGTETEADAGETATETADNGVEGPMDLADFAFDLTFRTVLACAAGHEPIRQSNSATLLLATFCATACTDCAFADECPTRVLASGERQLRRASAAIATEVRQFEQRTPDFKDAYRIRSGIESTNRELKGRHGADDLRVRGAPRVSLAMTLKSLALNAKRAALYHAKRLAAGSEPCPCPG
jgi:hypothetical protein